jgi:hypothetical protein
MYRCKSPKEKGQHGEVPTRGVGDGGVVIEFGGVCYQDTYPMYLTCIVHVSCMYLDVSRQDTSRYIEIQQDTFVSVTLAIIGNVSYLRISILLYDTFRIQ